MSFDPFHVSGGDAVAVGTMLVMWLQYRLDRNRSSKEEQDKHQQNLRKFNELVDFQEEQLKVNEQAEQQLAELKKQTASIDTRTAVIAATMEGIDKRTTRIEKQLDRES